MSDLRKEIHKFILHLSDHSCSLYKTVLYLFLINQGMIQLKIGTLHMKLGKQPYQSGHFQKLI